MFAVITSLRATKPGLERAKVLRFRAEIRSSLAAKLDTSSVMIGKHSAESLEQNPKLWS